MDVLKGFDEAQYRMAALHTPKGHRPSTALVQTGDSLFQSIENRNSNLIDDFAQRRLRTANAAGGSDVYATMPRIYTPVEQFEMQKIPYNISNEKERFRLYQWLDLFYRTHYLIPILVDIFTRFPLVGLEFHSPDKHLAEFYHELFMDRLDYEHFLTDLGREYWTLGQAFPLGHFNETLGIWEEEELLDPTMVKVRQFPIIGGQQYYLSAEGMDSLRNIVLKKEPREVYYLLERDYPEWIPFLTAKKDIPVSNVLLKQVAFKASPRDDYGTPILLRALRTLMHEEKLLASQDAIAERLYSPMIMVKLGIQDMGQQRGPWIPTPAEVQEVRNTMDIAMSSDFRMMVHHFGIEVQNVFGREQMPRLDADFDRIERRIMQTFGINPSLLSGGAASQPYASSALQAEFLNQILRTYQGYLKRHYESRAYIVAEAQEHYAYDKRGDTRIPIIEEVMEYDEETGEPIIVQKKKLMIPELRMKVLDLRDEATQRQFLQSLKQQGVAIPDQQMAMGMSYDFEEFLAQTEEEMIAKTVSQQEAKVKTYDILTAKGLPIPPELKAEVEGMANFQGPQPGDSTTVGIDPLQQGEEIVMPAPPGGTPAIGPNNPQRGQRPEVSDERNPIPPPGQVPNNMPTLPGVPGQPGMLGVPGAPTPAFGPGSRRTRVEATPDEPKDYKLPRKKNANMQIPTLRDGAKDATLSEDEQYEDASPVAPSQEHEAEQRGSEV
jgi:hypothetical protein